ncbi:hypothetical protein NVP2275O_400 [Vibrio phage 2.275.O._10N.286.54.E11]|nr:hypothetical protein NVP2275O_400 [Vibrio phage 2.275.O._10N.286.54.E11]
MEDGHTDYARIDNICSNDITTCGIATDRISIEGTAYIGGSTYIASDVLSHGVAQFGSDNTQGSVKIDPSEGGIFIHDGEDWTIITDTDKSKKYDATLQVLAEDYPEVLADLVLRGIVK